MMSDGARPPVRGGTTAKLSIVENNQPRIAYQFEAAREKRFAPGSGLPINISTVELIEIGAGGGSIEDLDTLSFLKVGPRSAGSQPGPACYTRGGSKPTVTDASLLVGHLDAETFAGGTMKFSRSATAQAVHSIALPLKLDSEPFTFRLVNFDRFSPFQPQFCARMRKRRGTSCV